MYGPPGRAYVYLVYGMHDCLNIVTERVGSPAALLIRAVEPLEGIAAMRAARERRTRARTRARAGSTTTAGTAGIPSEVVARHLADARLGAGPGLVCAAFDLDRSLTGRDLLDPDSDVRIEPSPADEPRPVIAAGPRVGVDYAGPPWTEMPWRRWIEGHPSLSRPPRARVSTVSAPNR
jgi:DNA-3-methyladenine glycosylase